MNWAAKGTHLNERPKTVIERGLVPYCSSHHIEDLGVVVRVRAVAIDTAWEERLTQLLLLDVLDEFAGNTPVEIVGWVGRGCKGVGGRLCLGMRMSWCAGVVEDTLLVQVLSRVFVSRGENNQSIEELSILMRNALAHHLLLSKNKEKH